MLEAVAEAWEVDYPGADRVAALAGWVADRRVLLVLDNLEQVLDVAPRLTRLLEAAPGLRLLVTSRSPLRVYGEHVHVLEPMDTGDAVPLFRDRAARAGGLLGAGDDAAVGRVCEALDRLPLAIELVAGARRRATARPDRGRAGRAARPRG